MSERIGIWSNTATGRQAYICDPRPEDVNIEDIALALAKTCRFGGHLRRDVWHYSVAQHSVHVSALCSPEHALIGLLHDASAAYVGDVVRPVKQALAGSTLGIIEYGWALAIGHAFGLGEKLADLPEDVVRADNRMLATERRDLIQHMDRPWILTEEPCGWTISAWSAKHSYLAFMDVFRRLTQTTPTPLPDVSAGGEERP